MDELISSRQIPHSTEAEQSVLGAMIIDSRCIPDVIGLLKPDDFYLQKNRELFEVIQSMFSYAETIDLVTVLDRMKERGVWDESSQSYVMQLMDVTPTAANVLQYAKILADKSMLRKLAEAADGIAATVAEGVGTPEEMLESAERRIYAIRQGRASGDLERIDSILLSVYERLKELSASENAIPGISTGFSDLDRKINGLNRSDLILIASRPGMGKTSIALNIALSAAKKETGAVVIFSLEMSKEQLVMRLLSSEAFLDNQKLVTGRLSMDDWVKIGEASAVLSRTNILVDDNPSVTVAEMNAKCRRIENLRLVIIDYLQLMTSAGGQVRYGENRTTIVGEISRALKIMAKELNVPVLCLSQLSRANESRADKRPMLSDLRESGAIEQDADEVMFLYRDEYYNEDSEKRNIAECIVAKNRHGETGTVELQWLPQFTSFSNLERRHEE